MTGGQCAIALAMIEDAVPVVGVLGCPNLSVNQTDGNYGMRGARRRLKTTRAEAALLLLLKKVDAFSYPSNLEPTNHGFCVLQRMIVDRLSKLAFVLGLSVTMMRWDNVQEWSN